MSQPNVFDWLDEVRKRPSMFGLSGRNLGELFRLESMIWGFVSALRIHHIDEGVPEMGHHFSSWLAYRTGFSCSHGWSAAITNKYPHCNQALAAFFRLVDEYRTLKPTRVFTVRLAQRHNPTGRRYKKGFDTLMEKPQRVDIIRYAPRPILYLRYHYPGRIENDGLMTGLGYAANLKQTKKWVQDELQVEPREWKPV